MDNNKETDWKPQLEFYDLFHKYSGEKFCVYSSNTKFSSKFIHDIKCIFQLFQAIFFIKILVQFDGWGQSAKVHILLSFLGPQGLPPTPGWFSTLRSRSCNLSG